MLCSGHGVTLFVPFNLIDYTMYIILYHYFLEYTVYTSVIVKICMYIVCHQCKINVSGSQLELSLYFVSSTYMTYEVC